MEPATLAILGSGLANAFGNVYSNSLNAANAAAINQKNADLQYALNLDNIEAARLNNLTAVDLANTAHQREVRDLRDAGLNPILSATGGNGAATPSLQAPSLDSPSLDRVDIVNPLSSITTAVGQAMQYQDQHRINDLQSRILELDAPDNHDGSTLAMARERRYYEQAAEQAEAQTRFIEASTARDIAKVKNDFIDRSLSTKVYDNGREVIRSYHGHHEDTNLASDIQAGLANKLKDGSFFPYWMQPINSGNSALQSLRSFLNRRR